MLIFIYAECTEKDLFVKHNALIYTKLQIYDDVKMFYGVYENKLPLPFSKKELYPFTNGYYIQNVIVSALL